MTGTSKPETMTLLPPHPDTCQTCATKHEADYPHNQQSLYYQMRFNIEHGRAPTWADAMAHCSNEVKTFWVEALASYGITVKFPESESPVT